VFLLTVEVSKVIVQKRLLKHCSAVLGAEPQVTTLVISESPTSPIPSEVIDDISVGGSS
jgi:hypothetical protein